MSRKALFLTAIMVMTLLAGCSKPEKDTPTTVIEPTPAPTETPEPTPTPTPEPTPAPVLDDGSDPLNGDPTANEYRPIIVMFDNSPQARPQYGIQSADIVYEAMVEGKITRLMGVFNSEIPDRIEPVRSARLYYIAKAGEYDGIYVHFGGTNTPGHEGNVYDYMKANGGVFKVCVDGLHEMYGTITRDKTRKAPHNAMVDLHKVRELYNWEPERRKYDFDLNAMAEGTDATHITIPFDMGSSRTEYDYDAEQGLYMRKQGGKVFKDANTDQQISIKNIIVEYAAYHPLPGTQKADVIGEGDALFFINGKVAKGKWSKASIPEPTVYTDENGEPIKLRPGNTWIHIAPTDIEVTYE